MSKLHSLAIVPSMSRGAYWIYYLDDQDNFLDAESVAAAVDLGALLHVHNHAQTKAVHYIIELWDRDRMLARLEPKSHKRSTFKVG